MNDNQHIPVLLNPIISEAREARESQKIIESHKEKGFVAFDGTFGGGSYTQEILDAGFSVYACDLDEAALARSKNIKVPKTLSFTTVHSNFCDYIATFEDGFFDLIVVDLGFSNNQLRIEKKGFSYQEPDQLLDLRYDESKGHSVAYLLNKSTTDAISKMIFNHSGEQFARKIALKIQDYKDAGGVIRTVADLVGCVEQAIPDKFKNKRNQVLARVWQALRIEVNEEFTVLSKFLSTAPQKLKKGGILCVVNFHSLEDKITTKTFRELSKPFEIDDYGNKGQHYTLLTKTPITPTAKELEANPQSRSATLRILKK